MTRSSLCLPARGPASVAENDASRGSAPGSTPAKISA